MSKQYLGDSVYADFDGWQICLTTENGIGASNTVYLEDQVIQSFMRYVEKCYGVEIKITKKEKENAG